MKHLFTLSIGVLMTTAILAFTPPAASLPMGGSQYIGPGAGFYQLPIASLNAHLKYNLGLPTGFDGNVMYVGLDRGRYTQSDKLELGMASLLTFHYLLPQTIGPDSLNFTLQGYNMQYDGASFDFVPAKSVTFTAGLAWSWGRTQIIRKEAAGETNYTNPYFIPMVRTELNVTLFEHLTVGVRAAYRHDWSKTRWKIKDGNGPELPGTRLSGGMYGAFIAFSFGGDKTDEETTVQPAPATGE
jgi:hypothetical protein